jgi:hypothetical protein
MENRGYALPTHTYTLPLNFVKYKPYQELFQINVIDMDEV